MRRGLKPYAEFGAQADYAPDETPLNVKLLAPNEWVFQHVSTDKDLEKLASLGDRPYDAELYHALDLPSPTDTQQTASDAFWPFSRIHPFDKWLAKVGIPKWQTWMYSYPVQQLINTQKYSIHNKNGSTAGFYADYAR